MATACRCRWKKTSDIEESRELEHIPCGTQYRVVHDSTGIVHRYGTMRGLSRYENDIKGSQAESRGLGCLYPRISSNDLNGGDQNYLIRGCRRFDIYRLEPTSEEVESHRRR
jgi:hypothetical protein